MPRKHIHFTSKQELQSQNEQLRRRLKEFNVVFDPPGPTVNDLKEDNRFLTHILSCEMATSPRKSHKGIIRTLFPDNYELPPAKSMSPRQLASKLKHVETVLEQADIHVDLWPKVPPEVKYTYIVEQVLPEAELVTPESGGGVVFTGCTGWCERCMQQPWCEADEPRG